MSNDKIDLISKDLEFVKDLVQDTSKRILTLEKSVSSIENDYSSRSSAQDSTHSEIVSIRQTLEKNTDSLISHMRRTELNEISVDELKKMTARIDSRLQPLEEHYLERKAMIKVIAKIGVFIGGLIGAVTFMYDLFGK